MKTQSNEKLFIVVPLALFAIFLPFKSVKAAKSLATLSDREIMGVLESANEAEIDAAQDAKSKSDNRDVKYFADQMISDHKRAKEELRDIAKEADAKPQATDTSRSLKDNEKTARGKISDLKAGDFDRAYLSHQIDVHQSLIKTIDESLMPQAQNDKVKHYLSKVRSTVQNHLNHAKQLQSQVKEGEVKS
jgi:putative membrane protein